VGDDELGKDSENPCTSNCKIRDGVCTGCGRLKDEIREWKRLKKGERAEVVRQAKARLKALKKKK